MPLPWFVVGRSLPSAFLLITMKRLLFYIGAGAFAVFAVGYVLAALAIHARFLKPIELSAVCPSCGSTDFRSSYEVTLDRIRKKLGIYPFRCRRCCKRFFRRSISGEIRGIPGAAGF